MDLVQDTLSGVTQIPGHRDDHQDLRYGPGGRMRVMGDREGVGQGARGEGVEKVMSWN